LQGSDARPIETYPQVVDLAQRRLLTDTVAVYEVPRN